MKHSPRRLAALLVLALVLATACRAPESKNSPAVNTNSAAANNAASSASDATGSASSAGNAASPASGAPGSAASSASDTNGNASSAGSAGRVSTPADAQALDGLTKAMTAQLSAKSFRARMDSVFGGQEIAQTIEYVAPDRFHMTGDSNETIVIGGNAWMRQQEGAWQKQSINASTLIAAVRDPKMIDLIRKNAEVRFIGPDTLDAKPMMVYEYTLRNLMGTGMSSHVKAWISVADHLPHRMETEIEIKGNTSKATITYFDYNADIKIEPPQ